MTNLIDNNLQQPEKTPTDKMLEFFKNLIGYEYYVVRAAFNDGDTEIAFVNEALITRIHVYVNGEPKVSKFVLCSDVVSDSSFEHNGVEYRIHSRCINALTLAQKVVLYRNGEELEQKRVPRLELLNWQQIGHLILGALGLGFGIAYIANIFI